MSFISSTNTLTLGSSDNTTINIGTTATNPTINIGTTVTTPPVTTTIRIGVTGDDNPVLIRGLDPLISSTTGFFADYREITDAFSQNMNCYYLLPYTTTTNILIQWGQVPDMATTTYNFKLAYNSIPYLFATKYNNGGSVTLGIISASQSSFQIDSSIGSTDKSTFNWLAIGLTNK
jgi:hypothetical protein